MAQAPAQEPAQEPTEELQCLVKLYNAIGDKKSIAAVDLAIRISSLQDQTKSGM